MASQRLARGRSIRKPKSLRGQTVKIDYHASETLLQVWDLPASVGLARVGLAMGTYLSNFASLTLPLRLAPQSIIAAVDAATAAFAWGTMENDGCIEHTVCLRPRFRLSSSATLCLFSWPPSCSTHLDSQATAVQQLQLSGFEAAGYRSGDNNTQGLVSGLVHV